METYMIRLNVSEAIDLVAALRQTDSNPALADRIKEHTDRAARNQVLDEVSGRWVSIPSKEVA